jgi:hypothetical protein
LARRKRERTKEERRKEERRKEKERREGKVEASGESKREQKKK